MENEQDAVIEPAESTAPAESAPAETETANTQPDEGEPASATTEPEKKVSESVPYERFKEVNDRANDPDYIARKAIELGLIQPQQPQVETGYFDEETTRGIESLAERKASEILERRETADWVRRNSDDLKNPLVDARTKDLIRSGIDRDKALAQAKTEVESMYQPKIAEAKAEGEKQGMDIANKKEQLGAIGSTAAKKEVDENGLSAKEYAERYGLKRV